MRKVYYDIRTLSIDTLIEELREKNNLIVYYRSGNDSMNLPVFLKQLKEIGKWAFVSPINNYGLTFESAFIETTLKEAAKQRQLYVITKDEANQLFKIQC
jgi:hypothetical protein